MDKKTQKRIQVIRQRLQSRRQQLASVKKQPDEPEEIARLTNEIAAIELEMKRLQEP